MRPQSSSLRKSMAFFVNVKAQGLGYGYSMMWCKKLRFLCLYLALTMIDYGKHKVQNINVTDTRVTKVVVM